MRPTIDEQIREMCRILETVIAPAVVDDHAAEILRGVIGNLGSLEGTWKQLAPFLHWDTLEMRALLRDHPALDGALASDIAVELAKQLDNSFEQIGRPSSRDKVCHYV